MIDAYHLSQLVAEVKKIKCKVVSVLTMKACWVGGRGIVPLFLNRATRYLKVSGQFHVLVAVSMGEIPPVPIE